MTTGAIHRIHLDETTSTMEAARAGAAGKGFLLVTAATQTGGKGTRGRTWQSPRGNLYFTVAVERERVPSDRLGLLPLDAGIALWEAVARLLPPNSRSPLRLKWPNDLLWEGRKTAGMLLEATAEHLFIGVGVNLLHAPEISDGGTPSGKLADAGLPPDAKGLLAEAFFTELRQRLTEGDSASTLSLWKSRTDWTRSLRLRDRPGRPEVRPVDINAEGHLRVRFADGREEWLISDYLA